MKKRDRRPPAPPSTYTVKSLVKALNILKTLAEEDRASFTLTDLSHTLRLHVSTVHRLLVNLVQNGFVEQDSATGGYQLSFRVLRMGLRVLDRLDFRRAAQGPLRELNRQTQETVHLAILENGHAVSIEKFGSLQPVGLDTRLGEVLPLHCTGVGKALLAFQTEDVMNEIAKSPGLVRLTPNTLTSLAELKKELARVREEGYALDREEAVPGLRCVAAPVFNHEGRVVASFSVAGPATRLTQARVQEILRQVRETSRQISYRLGYGTGKNAAATP